MGEVVDTCMRDDLPFNQYPFASPDKSQPLQHIRITNPSENSGDSDGHSSASDFQLQEEWLPITESRNGSIYTSVFHLLCSGIGIQVLTLPVAFACLGWLWGVVSLSLVFFWQLYTIWLLVDLHEVPSGIRYSRFLQLSIAGFGPKLGKLLAIFPVMYLSGGTCVILIITGGSTMELFLKVMCSDGESCYAYSMNGTLWFLIFTCTAIFIAQLHPNLNSIAHLSFIGAITAVGYCSIVLILSITRSHPRQISYGPSVLEDSVADRINGILNAIGVIALAFRGHNIVLEIQGTLPSGPLHSSKRTMWRGVTISYFLISICFYSVSVGGYWAYGNQINKINIVLKMYHVMQQIPGNGGMLNALANSYGHDTSKIFMGLIYFLVLINSLCSYLIFAMPAFDNLEIRYTSMKKRPCPSLVRICLRIFFGGVTFFVAVAFPFLAKLSSLVGGVAMPLTFAYPCFMWAAIKRSQKNGAIWVLNFGLGCLGIVLSGVVAAAAGWKLAKDGLHADFFRPQ